MAPRGISEDEGDAPLHPFVLISRGAFVCDLSSVYLVEPRHFLLAAAYSVAMPWVLGHDMSSELFANFAMRNKIHFMDEDFDASGIFAQFAVFKKCYETLKFGSLKKQIGMSSNGRGPRQVYYVHQVRDREPPVLRYGKDGCPTKRQMQALRLVHGRRREMWYPMANTLPWNAPREAKMPRPVVYEDEVLPSPDTSPSNDEAQVLGVEGNMQMLRIEEGPEGDEAPMAGPSTNMDQGI